MRVVVTQFTTSSKVSENLATCIRIINEAAQCEPSIIILPEFCNTQPWYVDHNHAWSDALTVDGQFFQDIAGLARQHSCYILLNVTLRRDSSRDTIDNESASSKSNISITSCLFSPLGKVIHLEDKKTLTTNEKIFFTSASKASEIITTSFGNLGLLVGDDSITYEASRNLALNGGQLLCNSINSFALDQSSLHDPARAFENNVFLATANKISNGAVLDNNEITSSNSVIPKEYISGVGNSQVISPQGKVLVRMNSNEEGFVFADISLNGAGLSHKFRPDGTKHSQQRLPELYLELKASRIKEHDYINKAPTTANIAIFATYKSDEQAIEDVCHYIENNLSDIIQLPELFFIADKNFTCNDDERIKIERLSEQLITQVSYVLRPFQYLCTSLIIDGSHQAVLINEQGLMATQQQLHYCHRYNWTTLGDHLNIIELPLEQGIIHLAMLTADDANMPEIVKAAALNDIQVLLVPFDIQEPCEVEYSLISRAAENRICIVAASREKSFDCSSSFNVDNLKNKNKVKSHKSTGFIANLSSDLAFLPRWKSQKYNGFINQPLVKHQYGKITKAVIHPIAARRQHER
jgi:predicted amidohydrolase